MFYLPVETQLWSSLWGRLVKMSWSVPCPSVQSCLLGTLSRERGCVKSPLAHLSLPLPPLPSLGDKRMGLLFAAGLSFLPGLAPSLFHPKCFFVLLCVCLSCVYTVTHTHNFQCVKGCSEVLLAHFLHLLQSITYGCQWHTRHGDITWVSWQPVLLLAL